MTPTQEQIDSWDKTDEDFVRLVRTLGRDYVGHRHTAYHYSINRMDGRKIIWRMNLYPTTGRIWCDPNYDDPPDLDLPHPWRLDDVVAALAKLDQIGAQS